MSHRSQRECNSVIQAYKEQIQVVSEEDLPPFPIEDSEHTDMDSVATAEQARTWKSKILGIPVFLGIIGLSISSTVGLQFISSYSRRNGGLFFVSVDSSFPVGQSVLYFYLPIILSTMYSVLWAWIDLDAKRLEPFWQLSQPGGAPAKRSLFLQYQFDFIATVPFKAAKNKHWMSFLAGLGMILVFWVISPLSGSIFTINTLYHTERISIFTSGKMLSPEDQVDILGTNFWNMVYAIRWLNSAIPKYTTDEVALMPFFPSNLSSTGVYTVTAETLSFGTNLDCAPASIKRIPAEQVGTTMTIYDNGLGCSWATDSWGAAPRSAKYPSVWYYGWWGPGEGASLESFSTPYAASAGSYCLNSTGVLDISPTTVPLSYPEYTCPKEFSNVFLAQWSVPLTNATRFPQTAKDFARFNQTVLFCTATYFQQRVNATISMPDRTVLHIEPLAEEEPLSNKIFNTTYFNSILGNDVYDYSSYDRDVISREPGNIANSTLSGFAPRLKNLGVVTGRDVSRYIFGIDDTSVTKFHDAQTLAGAFQRTHRLLFNAAVSLSMTEKDVTQYERTGTKTSQMQAITAESTFIIIMQTVLCVIAFIAILLLVLSTRQRGVLKKDPSSILDIIESLASLRKIPDVSAPAGQTCELRTGKSGKTSTRWQILPLDETVDLAAFDNEFRAGAFDDAAASPCHEEEHNSKPFKAPIQLRNWVGSTWVLLHLCGIVLFIVLKREIDENNGLPLPSQNDFLRNFVLSYVPIAFSTFLEPFWVLLSRTRCMLEPFNALSRGKTRTAASLKARYLSLPPQLVLWRAAKSGHFILALLCVVSVIANVLAVCLSQLFLIRPVHASLPAVYNATYAPVFSGSNSSTHAEYDYVYTFEQALAKNPTLPAWVYNEYFFVPAYNSSHEEETHTLRRLVKTRGFGVDLNCSPATIQWNSKCINTVYSLAGTFRFQNGSSYDFSVQKDSGGPGAHTRHMQASELNFPVRHCPGCFFASWMRAKHCSEDLQSVAVGCVVSMQTAMFEVTADSKGNVDKVKQIDDFEPFTSSYLSVGNDTSAYTTGALARLLLEFNWPVHFRNTTTSVDWLTYFMKRIGGNSTNFNDPYAPVPTLEEVVPLASEVIRRYFSIYMGLNLQWLSPANVSTPQIHGETIEVQQKVFFEPYMFQITISLFSFDLAVAFLAYLRRPRFFLRRLPITIAAILSYFAYSRALQRIFTESDWNEKDKTVNREVFAYGKFVGTDRKPHSGIEMQPYVVPLMRDEAWKRHRFWKSKMDV